MSFRVIFVHLFSNNANYLLLSKKMILSIDMSCLFVLVDGLGPGFWMTIFGYMI